MKATDSLSRRIRFAGPQPLDDRIEIGAADLELFDALQRHPCLPVDYLYEFAKTFRGNRQAHKHRLTALYNGAKGGKPYLERPYQQFNNKEARYQPLVYSLAPAGLAELAAAGRAHAHSPGRIDQFVHRLFTACASASFELACRDRDIRYITMEQILARAPRKHLDLALSGFGQSRLVPDDLFGLEYPGGGYRFFAVEIDRNTESIEREIADQNTMVKKFAAYQRAFDDRAYQEQWGIPNLSVLIYTTNETHGRNLLKKISRRPDKFAVKAEPMFGGRWSVPRALLPVFDPWERTSGPFDISKP
jgi:hypothetical protein